MHLTGHCQWQWTLRIHNRLGRPKRGHSELRVGMLPLCGPRMLPPSGRELVNSLRLPVPDSEGTSMHAALRAWQVTAEPLARPPRRAPLAVCPLGIKSGERLWHKRPGPIGPGASRGRRSCVPATQWLCAQLPVAVAPSSESCRPSRVRRPTDSRPAHWHHDAA